MYDMLTGAVSMHINFLSVMFYHGIVINQGHISTSFTVEWVIKHHRNQASSQQLLK